MKGSQIIILCVLVYELNDICLLVWYIALCDPEVAGSIPSGFANYFVEIDHGIYSVAISLLPLIEEGQLSVSGESFCTSTG